jgi:hypothetical protein
LRKEKKEKKRLLKELELKQRIEEALALRE